VKIRISFELRPRTQLGWRTELGYDLRQLFEAIGDLYVLWRAGRAPRLWLDRTR